jgi:Na+-transporting NADH:ubiquinone oxidoreductase subunit NqrC
MRQTRYRLLVIFMLSLGGVAFITSSFAGQVHDQELAELEVVQDNLDLQKEWVQYRNDTQVRHCYQLFFVERCLDRVRQTYLKEIKVVRVQELAMHDRRREVNEMIKTEKDTLRIAERQDPKNIQERADNRKAFEEKQILRAKRIEELEERRKDSAKRAQQNRSASPL